MGTGLHCTFCLPQAHLLRKKINFNWIPCLANSNSYLHSKGLWWSHKARKSSPSSEYRRRKFGCRQSIRTSRSKQGIYQCCNPQTLPRLIYRGCSQSSDRWKAHHRGRHCSGCNPCRETWILRRRKRCTQTIQSSRQDLQM